MTGPRQVADLRGDGCFTGPTLLPSMPLHPPTLCSDRGEVVLRLLAPGTQMAALIGPKGDTIRQVRGPGKGWIGAVEGWDERDTRKGVRVRCGRCAAQGGG